MQSQVDLKLESRVHSDLSVKTEARPPADNAIECLQLSTLPLNDGTHNHK